MNELSRSHPPVNLKFNWKSAQNPSQRACHSPDRWGQQLFSSVNSRCEGNDSICPLYIQFTTFTVARAGCLARQADRRSDRVNPIQCRVGPRVSHKTCATSPSKCTQRPSEDVSVPSCANNTVCNLVLPRAAKTKITFKDLVRARMKVEEKNKNKLMMMMDQMNYPGHRDWSG